jgi:hypothetical protein
MSKDKYPLRSIDVDMSTEQMSINAIIKDRKIIYHVEGGSMQMTKKDVLTVADAIIRCVSASEHLQKCSKAAQKRSKKARK